MEEAHTHKNKTGASGGSYVTWNNIIRLQEFPNLGFMVQMIMQRKMLFPNNITNSEKPNIDITRMKWHIAI